MTNDYSQKLDNDLDLITQIDEADVDLPEGSSDFIEACLKKIHAGNLLNERERIKSRALLDYVRRHEGEADPTWMMGI